MRLIKMLPVVGLCAASFLPASATAQQWIVNCDSNLCMDVTVDGKIQMAECDPNKTYQRWDVNVSSVPAQKVQNRGNLQCLDIFDDNTIHTSACEDWKNNQLWNFPCRIEGDSIESVPFMGKCLVAENNNLAPVTLDNCDPVASAKQWKCVNIGDTRPNCPPTP